jgi:hypothetical protein
VLLTELESLFCNEAIPVQPKNEISEPYFREKDRKKRSDKAENGLVDSIYSDKLDEYGIMRWYHHR